MSTKHVLCACLLSLCTQHCQQCCCVATLAGHALSTPFHKPVYPDTIPHSFHTCCHSHVICCQVTTLIIALCQHLYIWCRCTLIDPRPQKLSKTQRKWLQHFNQHRSCVAAGTEVTSNTAVVDCSDAETPAAGQGNDLPASASQHPQLPSPFKMCPVQLPSTLLITQLPKNIRQHLHQRCRLLTNQHQMTT